MLDWNRTWNNGENTPVGATLASCTVLEIADLAAQSIAVLSLTIPSPNSTYNIQFYGPTVHCALPNDTYQVAFGEFLADTLEEGPDLAGFGWISPKYYSLFDGSAGIPLLVYTSFSPSLVIVEASGLVLVNGGLFSMLTN